MGSEACISSSAEDPLFKPQLPLPCIFSCYISQRAQVPLMAACPCPGSASPPSRAHPPDEAGDVHVDKGGHQVLAVKAIHDPPVARDGVGKVLAEQRDGTEPLPGSVLPLVVPLTMLTPCPSSSQKAKSDQGDILFNVCLVLEISPS